MSTGHKIVLIRPDGNDFLFVDHDTYGTLGGDGSLVKAAYLPSSRVAIKVSRQRLDTL
ncbi:MAG: hypothetical protein JXR49_23535 [Acidobacteria bacterium]|nr:hypothetical protein [Acidobacteriota bacterium]